MSTLAFAKGHGTGNDFVIVPDPSGELTLLPERVAQLCDRRRGIGGDGLLRVVRTAALVGAGAGAPGGEDIAELAARSGEAEWFMDYRNADGSLADMCGNGARVFARFLVESGLASGDSLPILTRAGVVTAQVGTESVAVTMPTPSVGAPGVVRLSTMEHKGTAAYCGNPNLVCVVEDPSTMDLSGTPELDPEVFPAGANVEFIALVDTRHVRMRVVERGVGETLSCGSGACAVAAVVLHDGARETGRQLASGSVIVDVPGGRLTVSIVDGVCVLAGPAVIVASGTTTL